MSRLGTETAFEVLARARALEREGREVIHLEIGEPDFDTPSNIVKAGALALHEGATHYTPSAGIDDLREIIAADQTARKGIVAAPENEIVTPGGKPILCLVMIATLDEGDDVSSPCPGMHIHA